jgi:hypothetical protein
VESGKARPAKPKANTLTELFGTANWATAIRGFHVKWGEYFVGTYVKAN